MRQWLTDPKIQCRKHLVAEHVEHHMFIGTFKQQKQINGYIKNNLIEPKLLEERHNNLVNEMINRNYNHHTPIESQNEINNLMSYLPLSVQEYVIDRNRSLLDLISRCDICLDRFCRYYVNNQTTIDSDNVLDLINSQILKWIVKDYNNRNFLIDDLFTQPVNTNIILTFEDHIQEKLSKRLS
jgi:hypothetical protein